MTVNKSSDVTINYREGQVAAIRVLPQANMQSLTSQGFAWTDYAIDADTDDPFFQQLILSVQVNADFAVLVAGQVYIIHGGKDTSTERIDLPFSVKALAAGAALVRKELGA